MKSVFPSPHTQDVGGALDAAIEQIVAPRADETDRAGTFPQAAMEALARCGVLGLMSAPEVGGGGASLAEGCRIVERLAAACGSTAMVVLMHYAATAVIEAHGPQAIRRAIAEGRHLSTLAFSEAGSRSHFWAPVGTATTDGAAGAEGAEVRLEARKSWVTSADHADSYVWSSLPLAADGPMTLWLVPSDAAGLSVEGAFDGLGLRGNASSPVTAKGVCVPVSAMLGGDGAGLAIALETALPRFLLLSAAFSVGLMGALVELARVHLSRTRLSHLDESLAEQPAARAEYARLRIRADEARAFLRETLAALESGAEEATLRVLQVKAVAAEAASLVADGVMRLCGGSAFRRELGLERRFRDALAARVMAPTTPALYDLVGRASLGMELFGGAR